LSARRSTPAGVFVSARAEMASVTIAAEQFTSCGDLLDVRALKSAPSWCSGPVQPRWATWF